MRVVVEGGGCRSAYSAGVLQVLARSGVPVESIIGSSSGSMNSAFFAAGQTNEMVELWTDERFAKRMVSLTRFFNPFSRRPGLDVDDLVDNMLDAEGHLDAIRATSSATELYAMVMDVDNIAPYVHRPTADTLWPWLKASMAMPLAYNKVVTIEGRRFVDGGVLAPVPYKCDLPPPTNDVTVVILTRRAEVRKQAPAWWARSMMSMLTLPQVFDATMVQHDFHNKTMDELVEADRTGRVILVEPPRGMPISRLTTDGAKLRRGHADGVQSGEELLRRLEARL